MTEKEMLRRWVDAWAEAGPELERIRLREIREEDALLSLQILAPAFEQALRDHAPEPGSGLVEITANGHATAVAPSVPGE